MKKVVAFIIVYTAVVSSVIYFNWESFYNTVSAVEDKIITVVEQEESVVEGFSTIRMQELRNGIDITPSVSFEKMEAINSNQLGEDLVFDPLFYPFRQMLSPSQQRIYNQIYENMMLYNTKFTLVEPINEELLHEAFLAVYSDHPEVFWVDTNYKFGYYEEGTAVTVTLEYNYTINEIEKNKAIYNGIIDSIIEIAETLPTDFERELYVYNAILSNCIYLEGSLVNQSAYSALVLGESVCAGYSRAFQDIMIRLGVPTYYCSGEAGGPHSWNIIKLDDGYYNVDVSWGDDADDYNGEIRYHYFNQTDEEFAEGHERTSLSKKLPICNATGYSIAEQGIPMFKYN